LFTFEAFNILFKSLFENTASVVTIYCICSLSACCVSSRNAMSGLYSWTNFGGFSASEGLPENLKY